MKKYLYIFLLIGVCFGQIAKTSYVDRNIKNLKFDLEYKIRELEKKLSKKDIKHIEQIYPDGTPKEVFIYSENEELEVNQPFVKISKFSYDSNGYIKQRINYFDNGRKKEELNYKNGEKDGFYITWFENGTIENKIEFKNGNENGSFNRWYDNGQKSVNGKVQNGKEIGIWKGWYKSGKAEFIIEIKNGEVYSEKRWNEDGTIKNN